MLVECDPSGGGLNADRGHGAHRVRYRPATADGSRLRPPTVGGKALKQGPYHPPEALTISPHYSLLLTLFLSEEAPPGAGRTGPRPNHRFGDSRAVLVVPVGNPVFHRGTKRGH